jgi:hypothetical protein
MDGQHALARAILREKPNNLGLFAAHQIGRSYRITCALQARDEGKLRLRQPHVMNRTRERWMSAGAQI